MTIIDEFLERYSREFDAFAEAARLVQTVCEEALLENGIRAIVSSRAKRIDRLREKVKKRNKEKKKYTSVRQIYKDIVDLAGVRISLYFPGDSNKVEGILRSKFRVGRSKCFPERKSKSKSKRNAKYQKKFSGYSARHYRLRLKRLYLIPDKRRYAEFPVEVQVASVLMHGWAEVEHDLVYKPLSGNPSRDELAILDELNGLVLAGGIALERLQNAVKIRVGRKDEKFQNHYELATYIFDKVRDDIPEPVMGRVDVLLRFLQLISKDHPGGIDPYLDELDRDTEQRPLVDQIVDRMVKTSRRLYEDYGRARREIGEKNPYQDTQRGQPDKADQIAFAQFVTKWRHLEGAILRLYRTKPPSQRFFHSTWSSLLKVVLPEQRRELSELRNFRNEVVHGTRPIGRSELTSAGERVDRILKQVEQLPSQP
jgi:ppGpp synthetase/RelA/SpoT-type nucleotidyltranferase